MSENRSAENEHAGRVRDMFATIARRYDLLNHLLSANIDKRWRRVVANSIEGKIKRDGARILDVASGTGDLAATLFEVTGAEVVATDFCRPMLDIAAEKIGHDVTLIESDALRLPFRDGSFDAVTIGFGLRNVANVQTGLAELGRVLRSGGWLAVLEFSRPANAAVRAVFGTYFTRILPVMGGVVSGSRSAYTYLPDSVKRFPDQQGLKTMIEQAGFEEVSFENLTGGIAALHLGRKP
ncbi:MAG TPA: bifunctional demethylmenaquinone methyltransferase/2-methoxy-6-polyprenyl-1,4-benzoquinol methylase UbiE [Pyrinomonadaceae bacterium]|nr:bifunctional demethylmenaquinone methyltransferase/2-methoxy-6-polyprenyl-1,4-benzoquinol methylase UbiE [Pyrinomonadaceae bacterium]